MLFGVVIPMYNESEVIETCARDLTDVLEAHGRKTPDFRYEILFSDDGSTDGCGAIMKDFAEKTALSHGSISVLRAEENRGKGAAVRAGMLESRADVVSFTDSDLAYGAEILLSMLDERERTGVDLLIGSRALAKDGYAGYTAARKLASRVYLKLLSLAAGFRHTDSQCGVKLFSAPAVHEIFSRTRTDGWAFDLEVLLRAEKLGFTVGEYPVTVLRHRASKVRLLRDSVKMFREVFRIRREVNAEAAGKPPQR